MLTDYEKFKNVASGIQSYGVTLAAVAAGTWAIYTFWALGARQSAQTDLAKQELTVAREQEQIAREMEAIVDISIDARQEQSESQAGYFIAAVVTISNKGTRYTFLDFESTPLQISEITFDDGGQSRVSWSVGQESLLWKSTVLRGGATFVLPFLVRVPRKGSYLVGFKTPLDTNALTIHQHAGGAPGSKIYWAGNKYHYFVSFTCTNGADSVPSDA